MDKPRMIMLPGWSMDRSVWGSFSEGLSSQFELEHVDWTDVESTGSFREKARDRILKAEKRKVVLLGWSLGAIAALEIASEMPEHLDSMVLISPTARFTQDRMSGYRSGWSAKVLDRMIKKLALEGKETVESFRENLLSESDRIKMTQGILEDQPPQADYKLRLGLEYLKEADLRERICRIKVPTLMVHGEEDEIVPSEASKYMAERNPDCFKLRTIEGCGHIPFLTETELCLEHIREFMDWRKAEW